MNRETLGALLLNWHSSMNDPIYAVGSFYVIDKVYPDQEVVENALINIENDLSRFNRMAEGIPVKTSKTNDLRAFAGYSDSDIGEHLLELRKIVRGLKDCLDDDYQD